MKKLSVKTRIDNNNDGNKNETAAYKLWHPARERSAEKQQQQSKLEQQPKLYVSAMANRHDLIRVFFFLLHRLLHILL